jgi:hypothetical protein
LEYNIPFSITIIEVSFELPYTNYQVTTTSISNANIYGSNFYVKGGSVCDTLNQIFPIMNNAPAPPGSLSENINLSNETEGANGTITFNCTFEINENIVNNDTANVNNISFKIKGIEAKRCDPNACNGFSAGCVGVSTPHCFPMPNYELNTASDTFEATQICNNTGYPLIKNGQPICDCSLIPEFTGSNCSDEQPLCTGIRNPCAYDSTFCRVNQTTENSYCECNRNYTAFNDGTQTQLFGGDTCEIQYNYLQGKHGK